MLTLPDADIASIQLQHHIMLLCYMWQCVMLLRHCIMLLRHCIMLRHAVSLHHVAVPLHHVAASCCCAIASCCCATASCCVMLPYCIMLCHCLMLLCHRVMFARTLRHAARTLLCVAVALCPCYVEFKSYVLSCNWEEDLVLSHSTPYFLFSRCWSALSLCVVVMSESPHHPAAPLTF